MTLVVGENSYLSVEEADAYVADRLDADIWLAATPDRKAQALVTATRALDRLPLLGKRVDGAQPFAFPRCRMTAGGWLCEEAVPQAVLDATCEQALFLLALTGYEHERRRQHILGVIGGSLGSANEYSDTTLVRQNRQRTPLCPEARELLAPWLAGSVAIR